MKRSLMSMEWYVLMFDIFSGRVYWLLFYVYNFQPKDKGLLSKYDDLEGEEKKTFRLGMHLNKLKDLFLFIYHLAFSILLQRSFRMACFSAKMFENNAYDDRALECSVSIRNIR